jgi:hypothetical protein
MSWNNEGGVQTLVHSGIIGSGSDTNVVIDKIPKSLNTGMCFFGGTYPLGTQVEQGDVILVAVSLYNEGETADPANIYHLQFVIGDAFQELYFVEFAMFIPKPNMLINVTTSNQTNQYHHLGNLSYTLSVVQFS